MIYGLITIGGIIVMVLGPWPEPGGFDACEQSRLELQQGIDEKYASGHPALEGLPKPKTHCIKRVSNRPQLGDTFDG